MPAPRVLPALFPVRPQIRVRLGLLATTLAFGAVLAPTVSREAKAGCKCGRSKCSACAAGGPCACGGAAFAAPGPFVGGEVDGVAPLPEMPPGGPPGFAGPQGFAGPVPFGGPRPLTPEVPPPRGTLGRTYLQPSCPVPENEHPRTAMLHVRCAAGAMVCVSGMKGELGTDGIWRFRTEKPLIPGVPHIVEVSVTRAGGDPGVPAETYTIRLIMGRVVGLTV